MGRPRMFDHDEARARYQAGETMAAIAASYGVSAQSVGVAIRGGRQANTEAARARYLRPCVRGCGRQAWHQPGHEGVCRRCRSMERATSVRDTELRCGECGGWKPDGEFPRQAARIARRGHHSVCRDCQAAARQRTRERHKTPCARCGRPRASAPQD